MKPERENEVKAEETVITKGDLKELIDVFREAIDASHRPPPPTPQELASIAQQQAERKANSEAYLQAQANKAYSQQVCSHMHSQHAGGGGGTHMVHVHDNDYPNTPGYLLCQKCQVRIRPETPLFRKLDPQATFDTEKFNWYFQVCVSSRGGIVD